MEAWASGALRLHSVAFCRGFALGFWTWFNRALLPFAVLIAIVLEPSVLRDPRECLRASLRMWRNPL